MKTCRRCDVEKSLDDFYPHPQTKDGRQSYCKPCQYTVCRPSREKRQEYLWKHRYGITRAEVEDMSSKQEGLCLICKEREWTDIDHDHETGEVRALLCGPCNRSLGVLEPYIEAVLGHLGKV